ncbi:MAG: hypothetical protein HRT35_20570 [Algicola sp.]|nr:hypothetical protein [Algicola sp.]
MTKHIDIIANFFDGATELLGKSGDIFCAVDDIPLQICYKTPISDVVFVA